MQYLLDREDVKAAWHEYTHHEFVNRMGDGTLPRETFKYYMIQDYLYLVRSSTISYIWWHNELMIVGSLCESELPRWV